MAMVWPAPTVALVGQLYAVLIWSEEWGARDLYPGPHGPEPCWLHTLQCPGGSSDARLNSNCRTVVSVGVLLEPPGSANLCPGCAPACVLISPIHCLLGRAQPLTLTIRARQ